MYMVAVQYMGIATLTETMLFDCLDVRVLLDNDILLKDSISRYMYMYILCACAMYVAYIHVCKHHNSIITVVCIIWNSLQ